MKEIHKGVFNSSSINFAIGVASSAYQVEGAISEDGKGENVIDRYSRTRPDWVVDGTSGETACDSYHNVEEDVDMINHLGVDFYRFSIAWTRILPTGDPTKINQVGLDYYNRLLDLLSKHNIHPMVTMYHWDLPQSLQDLGGWANPHIVPYFVDYARILFREFGNKVRYWCTLNEPQLVSQHGYGGGASRTTWPPGVTLSGVADYLSQHNMVLAHAAVYAMYQKEFQHEQAGKVGPVFQMFWMIPKTDSAEDKEAARRARLFEIDSMMHPLVKGDYPHDMKEIVRKNSEAEGRSQSRLPAFTQQEVELIKGSYDFIGLNHYSTFSVAADFSGASPSQTRDVGGAKSPPEGAKIPAVPWLAHEPEGIRHCLNYIREEYSNPYIIITENGCDDPKFPNDEDRIQYIRDYLKEITKAVSDGCRVMGYTLWSLMDSFEWDTGYGPKFGLYHVDFNDKNRKRTAKKSTEFVKKICEGRNVTLLNEFYSSTEGLISEKNLKINKP